MRPSPEERTVQRVDRYDSQSTTNQTHSFLDREYWRQWSGSNSPGFPREKRENSLAVSIVQFKTRGNCRVDRSYPGTIYWDRVVAQGVRNGYVATGGPPSSPYFPDLVVTDDIFRNLQVNKAMDDVRAQSINLAQTIAERRQLISLLDDTVKRLTQCIVHLKRGRPTQAAAALGLSRSPKKLSGSVSQNWLALQYGWKPLLSDVKGAAEHLARNMLGNPIYVVGRSSGKYFSPEFSARSFHNDFGFFEWKWSPKLNAAKCELRFVAENDFIRQGSQLGLTDPMTLAWELLPWSFVIDWFLPIGDFISRLSYDQGLRFQSGYVTALTKQTFELTPIAGTLPWNNGGIKTLSGKGSSQENIRFTRQALTSPPSAKFPQLKDPFSVVHVLNALALARGQFKVR